MTPPPADLLVAPPAETATLQCATLCHCLKVTRGEVADAIDLHGCESVEHVTNACGAGGGCTACHRKIRALLARR
ncbi:MAG: (2Fe-2S)-binding protein [Planctomycetaceae bacterium]